MSNPVFTRSETFQGHGQQPQAQAGSYGQPQAGYQQPTYGAGYQQPAYGQTYPGQVPAPPTGVMTIDDVITKSAITLGVLFLSAAATFMLMPITLVMPVVIVSALVGFVTVMVVSMRRVVNPAAVLAYAVVEGVFVGAFSKLFETMWPGIVAQAILGTFIAAGVTLAAYRGLRIRVTDKFRRIVTLATMGIAAMFLVNLIFVLFGANTGLVGAGPNAGLLSWVVSAVCVVLAVSNLIMDFDYIERGIASRAPATESWRAAFGLTVTMVWLYTELLRILSYFRN